MTKKTEIAKAAAKEAAVATYKAVMGAPTYKVATIAGPQELAPPTKEIAKIAATAVYKSIAKLGQHEPPLTRVGPSVRNPGYTRTTEELVANLRNIGAPEISRVYSASLNPANFGQQIPFNATKVDSEWPAVAAAGPEWLSPEDKKMVGKLVNKA